MRPNRRSSGAHSVREASAPDVVSLLEDDSGPEADAAIAAAVRRRIDARAADVTQPPARRPRQATARQTQAHNADNASGCSEKQDRPAEPLVHEAQQGMELDWQEPPAPQLSRLAVGGKRRAGSATQTAQQASASQQAPYKRVRSGTAGTVKQSQARGADARQTTLKVGRTIMAPLPPLPPLLVQHR